jgi:outer membrane protein, adhesin transport system
MVYNSPLLKIIVIVKPCHPVVLSGNSMKLKVFMLVAYISNAALGLNSGATRAQLQDTVSPAANNTIMRPDNNVIQSGSAPPDSTVRPPTSFKQILEAAWLSHPVVLGKKSAQVAAKAEQKGARWQFFPTPSFEASQQDSSQSRGQGVFRLEQPIWTGGRLMGGVEVANSRYAAAGAALQEVKYDLSLKIVAVYVEALRQHARMQHATTNLAAHEKLLNMIKRRVEQDVSSSTDQRLTESRYFLAANDLSAIKQAYNNALTQLSQINGAPVTHVSASGVMAANTLNEDAPKSLDEMLVKAAEYSPILQRLAYEQEAALADISVKRAAYHPLLALRFESSRNQALGTTEVIKNDRLLAVLVGQPGAGLAAVAGVDSAIARHDAARLTRESAQRDLNERVTLDWTEWVAAKQRLENANQSSIMSEEVFESYTRQYTIGRKSWLDVLNTVREATQAKFALEDVRAQALSAGLRLRVQIGLLAPTPAPAERQPFIRLPWME